MVEIQTGQPVRTCVGCRQRTAKRELLRVTLVSGEVVPDPRGRAAGRGAHLHPSLDCLELAVRRRAFARALRSGGGTTDPAPLAAYLTAQQTDGTDQEREH